MEYIDLLLIHWPIKFNNKLFVPPNIVPSISFFIINKI